MFASISTMNADAFLCVLVVTSSIPDLVLTTNSDVVIQNTNTTFVCGRNQTLTCKFKKITTVIVWKNDNDIIPIAQCTRSVCRLNPVYVGQYNISFDMAQRIFSLELIQVTMKDNGTKLVCSDGSHTDSLIIRVKRYEPRLFEDEISGIVKATSDCTSRDKHVSFEWIKISARSNVESTINRTISYKNTSCSTHSECGNDNNIEYTSIIFAKSSDNGNYYLKIAVIYGNERIESRKSAIKYMIDGQDDNRDTNSYIRTKPGSIVAVAFVVAFVYSIILATIFIVWCCKRRKEKPNYSGLTQSSKGEKRWQKVPANARSSRCPFCDEKMTENIFISCGGIFRKICDVIQKFRGNYMYLCPFCRTTIKRKGNIHNEISDSKI